VYGDGQHPGNGYLPFADSQLNSTPDFTTSGSSIHLFSNAAHLSPGQVLEPQGDVITALKEGVILTLVTFRGP
jgi:hypothetical protein